MLVGAWVVATAVATLVAWAAVRQVTDEVSPQAAFPLPNDVALADASPTPSAAPARQRPKRTRPRREPPASATTAPGEPTQRPADPPPATQPPDAEPEPEPQPDPEARTQVHKLTGGIVTVRYSGQNTNLVSATPNSGFVVEINDSGPDKVDVRFRSDHHESRLVTRMHDGQPDTDRDEQPR
jgi:hypothetical protein